MIYSLKKNGYFIVLSVACLLLLVVFLGFRQYQLTRHYNTIISESEESIFQFSTIREQITASLIEQNWDKVVAAVQDFKDLNVTLARLQENELIPAEYKLDMAKQVDLPGLAIASKKITASEDKVTYSLDLQHQMRALADYLLRFDRIIVSQMRAKVIHFQTIMIGGLGIIICIISFSLILLYQKAMFPLIRIVDQASADQIPENGLNIPSNACAEITRLSEIMTDLFRCKQSASDRADAPVQRDSHLADIINEGTNLSNGIINYAQLLSDSCQEHGESTEERMILGRIISAGERIAAILKKI